MASTTLPYTYIQCPCTSDATVNPNRNSVDLSTEPADDEADEGDFDPRAPRANHSLYPLDYLLYCEDCQQIRCPRCVLEEIVTWFCPNCLFEVPSSTIKSEGNRCTRNCFECPICISPLAVTSAEASAAEGLLGAEQAVPTGPWVLSCSYCSWSSLEIGVKFDKPTGIYNQLYKKKDSGELLGLLKGGRIDPNDKKQRIMSPLVSGEDENYIQAGGDDILDPDVRFKNLKSFYQSQLADNASTVGLGFTSEYGYGSPASLSRIMGLYTGGNLAEKKSKSKTGIMREAQNSSEGLCIWSREDSTIDRLKKQGWEGTSSQTQRSAQPTNPRYISDLRPVPYLLRTKRSKRCRACKHILTKPESKVQTTRFRIRLVALSYIPRMTIRALSSLLQAGPTPSSSATAVAPIARLLTPLKPVQFLLTLKNPLFDPIKVTLATPTHTPGRFSSKITILCPQFEVGANTDVWDEALQDSNASKMDSRSRATGDGQSQAEAGKIWERGRNWVSVVVEVVPATLKAEGGLGVFENLQMKDSSERPEKMRQDIDIGEDEDILEIPVFVRLEWEADITGDDTGVSMKDKESKEKRELAYWSVLGVGRIARS